MFQIHVLKEGKYLKVPILPQTVALKDVRVDEKPTLIVSESGYHQLVISKPGEYVVTARFSLKTSLQKGPHKIDLSIQQTPITLLNLELPLQDIDVEIPQAQQLLTSAEVKITESESLEPVAVQKLPRSLSNKSMKPLMYGFKYINPTTTLNIN